MRKIQERLSPIQLQRSNTKIQTGLKRKGRIERGHGMAPVTRRSAEIDVKRSASRVGSITRARDQQKKYGQEISSKNTGMTAYNRIFEILTVTGGATKDSPTR